MKKLSNYIKLDKSFDNVEISFSNMDSKYEFEFLQFIIFYN